MTDPLDQVGCVATTAACHTHETLADLQPLAMRLLQTRDLSDLARFHAQVEDGDGYTVDKDTMKRLAALGAVQSHGFGRYSLTAFGAWLLHPENHDQALLPLRTTGEWNARERAGHTLYLKDAAINSVAWVTLPESERELWRCKATAAGAEQTGLAKQR
ncbi:hypothetical protein [Ralstonia sp. ASV6]|uniref:hypothetical protein n=1 Tax=Ralstonia sp. ASV6 TaxID=2795124 RepID=UPI0018EAFEC7|nr:hypothetical protein [Ralstonia sp. ASV6]